MRIDPSSFDNNAPHHVRQRRPENAAAAHTDYSALRHDVDATGAHSATVSGDLARLTEQVRITDEVRKDAVQAARQRLQRGDYLTREAAEQTVDGLLRHVNPGG